MRMWQPAQRGSLLCFSVSWRTVSVSVASSSGRRGTSLGGRGSFSPRMTSLSQLPRRIGLVREAPDCFESVVAWARMPPRENCFTPSTRCQSLLPANFTPVIP